MAHGSESIVLFEFLGRILGRWEKNVLYQFTLIFGALTQLLVSDEISLRQGHI